jgi:hypothetical protein
VVSKNKEQIDRLKVELKGVGWKRIEKSLNLIFLYLIFETVGRRRCYGVNETGDVNCCCFHPSKPKLACGLGKGKVCLFSGTDQSTPFSEWTETVLEATKSSWVSCIDWKVRLQNPSCANFSK